MFFTVLGIYSFNSIAEASSAKTDAKILDEKVEYDHSNSSTGSKMEFYRKIIFYTKKAIDEKGFHRILLNPATTTLKGVKGTVTHKNGEKIKITKKDVYKKMVVKEWGNKKKEYKIIFPDLQPFSTVEFSYYIHSTNVKNIVYWPFQANLPILKSSVTFHPAPGYRWGYSMIHPLAEPQVKNIKSKFTPSITIIRENIPAYEEEAFCQDNRSFREGVVFYYSDADKSYKNFWEEFGKNYYKRLLKRMLKPCRTARKIIKQNPDIKNNPVLGSYNYIQQHYAPIDFLTKNEEGKINKKYRKKLSSSSSVKQLFNLPYLFSNDICFITANLIKAADKRVIVDFVFYVPWDEGVFNPNITTISQFSNIMLRVNYNNKIYWLSPSLRFLPVNMMEWGARGISVFICGENGVHIEKIPLDYYKNNIQNINVDVNFDDEGKIIVKRTLELNPYQSYEFRKKILYYNKSEQTKKIEELLQDKYNRDLKLISCNIQNLEKFNKNVILKEEFNYPYEFDEVGEQILFHYPLFPQIKSNPFTEEKRRNPILFHYPYKKHFEITYHFGEDNLIKSVPHSGAVNKRYYVYRVDFNKIDDHTLKLTFDSELQNNMFSKNAYNFLKKTFASIINIEKQATVLQQSEE